MSFGFSDGPQFSTIPAVPASGWVTPIVQQGSTHTNTTLDTLAVGTSMLAVGMPVSGTGIPAGATIATIASATSVTLSIAATASASISVTFGGLDTLQSAFAGPSVFQGFPPASAVDSPGNAWAIPDQQVIAASGTYIFASGRGLLVIGQGTTTAPTLQYNLAGSWTTLLTASTAAATAVHGFMSDGFNVRINNVGSAGLTVTFYRERSSKQ